MKKVKQIKEYVIAELNAKEQKETGYTHYVYTKEEYSFGPGCRYPEHEAGSLQEAIEFVD
jgi:hypothetical protein